MQEFKFAVQGSAPEPYAIRFAAKDGELYGSCTCAAGAMAQMCKHRTAILAGDAAGIVAGTDQVQTIVGLLPGTKLQAALQAVATAEANLASAKKAVTAAKKQVGRLLEIPAD